MAKPTGGAAAARSADAVRLAANLTLRLDDPGQAWVVEDGDVLVFATAVAGGETDGAGGQAGGAGAETEGERHLLGGFGRGDVLLGAAPAWPGPVALLATGVGEAWVRPVPLEELC